MSHKDSTESIVLGGGCFWCLDAAFRLVKGVKEVVSGYAGGDVQNPTYELVCSGRTGHAEVVKVTFDPQLLSLHDVLNIFWAIHNPTTLNYQGNDHGTQYRSVIFFSNNSQLAVINDSIAVAAKLWDDPIVTEVVPLNTFYTAEPYHQNYFENHPEQAYCQVIINPKLKKLRAQFAKRLA